jgi:YesN/AraC family two-component response regulator
MDKLFAQCLALRISPKGFKVIGEASNGEEAWNVI